MVECGRNTQLITDTPIKRYPPGRFQKQALRCFTIKSPRIYRCSGNFRWYNFNLKIHGSISNCKRQPHVLIQHLRHLTHSIYGIFKCLKILCDALSRLSLFINDVIAISKVQESLAVLPGFGADALHLSEETK